jgi:pilus assembly protein CpaE
MSNVLRLTIVDPNDSTRDSLKTLLLGMDMVWLEAECSRYEFFADVVDQTNPDIGVVAMDDDPEKALALMAQLTRSAPNCSILVTSSSSDGTLILQAMRAGAKEFLTEPLRIEDLVAALDRIGARHGAEGEANSRSTRVIAVAGATGGVGTTSLAVNIGCAIASDEMNSAALVDMDLCLGDADVFLDTIPDYTLVDVAQNITRLDFSLLKKSLTKHSSGLFLLPRPVKLEDVSLINADDFRRVVGLLKATFSHLILDLSKGYSEVDHVAMEMADDVLLVTQLDLPCLRNAVRLMMSFEDIEGLVDKVKIVVNRIGLDDSQISLKKAQDTIGREIFWQVPNDYRVMADSRNNGVPLIEQSPKANVTQTIKQMAEVLASGEAAMVGAAEGGKSSIGRLFNFFGKGQGAGKSDS